MIESPQVSIRKAAAPLLAAMFALMLSACGPSAKIAELDDKIRQAEAAAQKAIAAQHAAESAAARIRRQENNDRRGEGDDEEANFQDTGPPPLAESGNDVDDEEPATPAPDA